MSCYNCGPESKKYSLTARLNKRITILRPSNPDDTDEYGEPINGPVPVATVWAAIEPLRGREFFAAMTENAEVTTRIRIRYRKDVDRTMTVKYKDSEFEILYIIHPEFGGRELQLMCKERQ